MNNAVILQKITTTFTEPIRDPLWGHIYLSLGFKKLLSCAAVTKLTNIRQLGSTHFVYPGATHTRLSHSLGVFEIAKRIICALLRQESTPPLTFEGVNSFLAACLLHDTGHFPYAHSLKELPLKEHEEITAEITLQEPILSIINKEIGGNAELAAAIVNKEGKNSKFLELSFYRHILSGVLDPDKLDYLNRDAFFCGIPYGQQDIDYVIDKIVPDPLYGIAVDHRGVEAIENILFSKYLMYKSVYWHKTVRIATAMIKKSLLLGINDQLIALDSLYNLDDYEFLQRFNRESYKYGNLVSMTEERNFYHSAVEISFDKNNELHKNLTDLNFRSSFEEKLTQKLSIKSDEIIIDIPEPISFETNLRIFEKGNFISIDDTNCVFNTAVIDRFQNSLRHIRILISPNCFLSNRQKILLEESIRC